MRTTILLTLTGPDRIGIVEDLTDALLALGANVESSRMARLGGEFAILMLMSLPADNAQRVSSAVKFLVDQGYRVDASETKVAPVAGRPFRVEVRGADHEGIVRAIARGLAESGVNIESVETGTEQAPTTGTVLFTMSAIVAVPEGIADDAWIGSLMDAGDAAGVDIEVSEG